MNQNIIFYPAIGMALLTFFVGIKVLLLRIKAVKKDGMNPAFFSLNRGSKQPDYLVKASQHYENLFELPLLFYVSTVMIYITKNTDCLYLGLAVSFVITRYLHAYIHMTYNNLSHRRNAFLVGSIILFLIWLKFTYHLYSI